MSNMTIRINDINLNLALNADAVRDKFHLSAR